MSSKGKNIYIACSMIKAKQLDFSLLDFLIEFVDSQNFHPFVPGKMADAPSDVIFKRDMNWLEQSDKIIADVNEPSHGVGMEIMYAYEHNIPVICLLNEQNKPLSRMVEGSPHTHLIVYKNKDDLSEKISKINLESLEVAFCNNCIKKTLHHKKICLRC